MDQSIKDALDAQGTAISEAVTKELGEVVQLIKDGKTDPTEIVAEINSRTQKLTDAIDSISTNAAAPADPTA